MAANNQAAELRQQARARRTAATRKVNRLEKLGIVVSGTKEDPRRPVEVVKRYNSSQLRKYIGELNAFTERNNQYVRGNKGAPIKRNTWKQYKALESVYNANADKAFEAIKNIKIDRANITIGERQAMLGEGKFPRAANPATNSPFNKMDRSPGGLPNNEAVSKLTKDLKKRTSKDFFKNEAARLKQDINKFFDNIGDTRFREAVNKMTPKQIHALNLTNFANAVGTLYEYYKRLMNGRNDDYAAKVMDDQSREAVELVNWARTIK